MEVKEIKGKRRLFWCQTQAGQDTPTLIAPLIEAYFATIQLQRPMRWGQENYQFARPVRWLVGLFDDQVVPFTCFGLTAGRESRGHRFLAPEAVSIKHAQDYQHSLAEGYVLADRQQRQQQIKAQVDELAKKSNATPALSSDLLEEITDLVEYPVALSGEFDADFLKLPAEAISTVMIKHQRYVPLYDKDGNILTHFIFVANIQVSDPAPMIQSNERVLRARLEDGAFYFNEDMKLPLSKRTRLLTDTIYLKGLGNYSKKTLRLKELTSKIADCLGDDVDEARKAASFAKLDLTTRMVTEFPELRGFMGKYYAQQDDSCAAFADTIYQHYLPLPSGNTLPDTGISSCLAIADRMDALAGCFLHREITNPSGSNDPFALRRAASGVVRIITEQRLKLPLNWLISEAYKIYKGSEAYDSQTAGMAKKQNSKKLDLEGFFGMQEKNIQETQSQLLRFILERFKVQLMEQGYSANLLQAAAVYHLDSVNFSPPQSNLPAAESAQFPPPDIHDLAACYQRVEALQSFSQREECKALATANKRVSNLLKKSVTDQTDHEVFMTVNLADLKEPAEHTLHQALDALQPVVQSHLQQQDYEAVLNQLATLRTPVDDFFEDVMVMTDDLALRTNRLALLKQLRELFLTVGDISFLTSQP